MALTSVVVQTLATYPDLTQDMVDGWGDVMSSRIKPETLMARGD
jgi:hypothetical protein